MSQRLRQTENLMTPSSRAVVSTRAPTSLQLTQGNAALRAGRYAEAVADYARLLIQAPELAATLAIADSLALARQRYRRERAATNAAPRVAVCGWSLGQNSAGRVDTLARLYQSLESLVEVEIIGCLFPNWGREIWAPIRQTPITKHSLLVEDESRFIEQALELVIAHPYDLVHLSKPRLPNILIGLLYKWLWGAAVLVDIDDEELAFVDATEPITLDQWLQQPLDSLTGQTSTQLAAGLANAFDGTTVANAALQQRYGGTIIRHARDERQFQPSAERRQRAREQLGIAPEQRVVLFLGTPRQHKGLLETGHALANLGRSDTLLLVIGAFPPGLHGLHEALQAIPSLHARFMGDQPFECIPDLLACGDIAVLMQDPSSLAARFQTPAKLGDALAMGLSILAEPTPGLAEFVECGAVIPVSRDRLALALCQALDDIDAKRQRAPTAHPAFANLLSYEANRPVLQSILTSHGYSHNQQRQLAPELARLCYHPGLGPLLRALPRARLADCDGVSIIILTLNGATMIDRLLRTFFATNTHCPVELLIVDHGPLDDPNDRTKDVIAGYRHLGDLWHIRRGANHSFSASCNYAAEWTRYPNLLFLNNDIIYSADALPAALAKLAEPDIGCVGIRLDDDPDSLPPGQEPGIQHLGIHFPWSEPRGYHHPRQIRHPSLKTYLEQTALPQGTRQLAVTGAFLLCRQRDFRRLGGFSTDYDYGLEDIDFCLRLTRDLGKSAWCLTSLGLQHVESSTRKRDRALTSALIERNHRQFKARWAMQTCALGAVKDGKVAVVVHVYYPDLWPEIAERLKAIRWPFELYITTTTEIAPCIAATIRAAFPAARIHAYPNLGMDVLPFLRLMPALMRTNYLAVCKLHTKRGDGEQGVTWRRAMLDPLIGDTDSFAKVVDAFARHPRLQLVGPAALYQSAYRLMLGNGPLVSHLYEQLAGRRFFEADWGFIVGNMFWIRPSVLRPLTQLMAPGAALDPELFEADYRQDGQCVHAIERVFGVLPRLQNGEVGLIHQAVDGNWCLQLPPPEPRIGGARIATLMPQYQRLNADIQAIKERHGMDSDQYLREWPELADSQIDLHAHHLLIGSFLE